MTRLPDRMRTLTIAAALAAVSLPALAQTAPVARVRGTIERLDGTTLVVKSREGKDVSIMLKDGYAVSGVAKVALSDIKAGDYVGTAAMPQGDGKLKALEVLVFPAGMKPGEGHRAWDLLPESTMTNATVAETVQSVKGRTLDLTYAGGKQTVEVPDDVPVVGFAPAEKADLKPGAAVFVAAQRGADGALSTDRVIVGNHGIAPPM